MTPKLLRSTSQASEWISQFAAGDRATAALLLESLLLVSHSQFQNGLFELTRGTRGVIGGAGRSKKTPAASLFAVREPTHITDDNGDDALPTALLDWWTPPKVRVPYFDPADDHKRPDAVAPGAGIGSEGPVANLIRDLVVQDGVSKFMDHPSIHSMRETKTRTAFVVDDIIGSGQRCCEFLDAFVQHPTIKSWHSRKHLQIKVLAYAGTEAGIQRVREHHYVTDVLCAQVLVAGKSMWTIAERHAVTRLCRHYSTRTVHSRIPLGFGGAFALLVFEHKCPNTAPPILWSSSRKLGWRALFKQRPGVAMSAWPIPVDETARQKDLLARIGQAKLASAAWQSHMTPSGRLQLLVLAAVAKRFRKTAILAEIVGLTQNQVLGLLTRCVDCGWVTSEYFITKRGLEELAVAKRLGLAPDESVELKTDFYFPSALRAARGSI